MHAFSQLFGVVGWPMLGGVGICLFFWLAFRLLKTVVLTAWNIASNWKPRDLMFRVCEALLFFSFVSGLASDEQYRSSRTLLLTIAFSVLGVTLVTLANLGERIWLQCIWPALVHTGRNFQRSVQSLHR